MKQDIENNNVAAWKCRMLWVWVVAGCLIPNVWLSMTERMSVVQSLTNIVLPGGLYMLLMSLTRKVGKASLWMSILFVFAAFQMVLLYMYGRSVIAVDMFLNVVTTNPGEVGELLGNMLVIIGVVIVFYLPAIVLGIVAVVKKWRISSNGLLKARRLSLWTIGVGLVLFAVSFTSARPYRPHCDIYPLNIAYNLEVAVHRTIRVAGFSESSAGFRYDAQSHHPDSVPEVYVLVIGETSRADNWGLGGYERATTPRLDGLEGLTFFNRVISESNTTHKSVPMLLTPLDATNFGDSIYYVKSLVTAFKDAGFHTAYFSAHSRNHSFIDFFGEEADTCFFIKEDGEHRAHYYDADLLPYLDEQLAAGRKKQLILLHAYGSHFNYIDRYPHDQAKFLPDSPALATYNYRDKQINAYDNTILYTSNFLADVIDRLKVRPGYAAMIYVSDHGEDIFDDERRLFLHASPVPSYYQLHVPMAVWINPAFSADHNDAVAALKANSTSYVSSSRSLFHTLLDIAGVDTPYLKRDESVANNGFHTHKAVYLNDHNDGIDLIKCGILDYDVVKLDSLKIPIH